MAQEGLLDHVQGRRAAQFAGHGSHAALAQAAGDDLLEEIEVVADVERHAVRGDPAAHPDADGRDLAQVTPRFAEEDAGHAFDAAGAQRELGQGVDRHLFEVVDVAAHVAAVGTEADDGVGHELPWHVAGHVAAARDVEHLDAALHQALPADEQMPGRRPAAQRHRGRVLQHEEDIALQPFCPRQRERLLQLEAVFVFDHAQVVGEEVADRRVHAGRLRGKGGEKGGGP